MFAHFPIQLEKSINKLTFLISSNKILVWQLKSKVKIKI